MFTERHRGELDFGGKDARRRFARSLTRTFCAQKTTVVDSGRPYDAPWWINRLGALRCIRTLGSFGNWASPSSHGLLQGSMKRRLIIAFGRRIHTSLVGNCSRISIVQEHGVQGRIRRSAPGQHLQDIVARITDFDAVRSLIDARAR